MRRGEALDVVGRNGQGNGRQQSPGKFGRGRPQTCVLRASGGALTTGMSQVFVQN